MMTSAPAPDQNARVSGLTGSPFWDLESGFAVSVLRLSFPPFRVSPPSAYKMGLPPYAKVGDPLYECSPFSYPVDPVHLTTSF